MSIHWQNVSHYLENSVESHTVQVTCTDAWKHSTVASPTGVTCIILVLRNSLFKITGVTSPKCSLEIGCRGGNLNQLIVSNNVEFVTKTSFAFLANLDRVLHLFL
jgi:hypothetical protein